MAGAVDRKALIERMKLTARRLRRGHVTRSQLRRATGISVYQVLKHFDSYNALLQAAGLEVYRKDLRISDNDLLRAMAAAFRKARGLVTRLRFARLCRYSVQTYERRWGSWAKALRAFRAWQEKNDPAFAYGAQIDGYRPNRAAALLQGVSWAPRGGRQYGEPLNFRGLLHEPLNEQGVVFLFATLAADLGFLVESLTVGFPDCEAKRRVGKAWERVRIEFEFESRNFRRHRHEPKECDLIVCWEHNWAKCPVPVLELKSVVAGRSDAPVATLS